MENNIEYVAYLRVSTQKQGYSGLGLDAQKDIIQNYLSDKNPIAEYIEIESGRKTDRGRPKLKEALDLCRKTGAKLIVAASAEIASVNVNRRRVTHRSSVTARLPLVVDTTDTS